MGKRNRHRRPVIGGVVNAGLGDTTKSGRRRSARKAARALLQLERDERLAAILLPTIAEVRESERTRRG